MFEFGLFDNDKKVLLFWGGDDDRAPGDFGPKDFRRSSFSASKLATRFLTPSMMDIELGLELVSLNSYERRRRIEISTKTRNSNVRRSVLLMAISPLTKLRQLRYPRNDSLTSHSFQVSGRSFEQC